MRCCCDDDDRAFAVATFVTWLARFGALVQWAVPLMTLVLVPKCPGCVAAYVVLFTGIGLSLPTAAAVRWGLIAVSVAAIAFLVARGVRRALAGPA